MFWKLNLTTKGLDSGDVGLRGRNGGEDRRLDDRNQLFFETARPPPTIRIVLLHTALESSAKMRRTRAFFFFDIFSENSQSRGLPLEADPGAPGTEFRLAMKIAHSTFLPWNENRRNNKR